MTSLLHSKVQVIRYLFIDSLHCEFLLHLFVCYVAKCYDINNAS